MALKEIAKVLKPGGIAILLEGLFSRYAQDGKIIGELSQDLKEVELKVLKGDDILILKKPQEAPQP